MRSFGLLAAALFTACSPSDPVVITTPKSEVSQPPASVTPPAPPAPPPSASAGVRANEPSFAGCFSQTADLRDGIAHASFSPKGERVAVVCKAGLEVIEIGARRSVVGRRSERAAQARFRDDGEVLAFVSDRLQLWTLATDAVTQLPAALAGAAVAALSPSFARAAVADKAGVITIVDATAGSALVTLGGGRSFSSVAFAWSPDGARVVTTSDALELWDVSTGKVVRAWKPSPKEELSADLTVFSANGAMIFAHVRDVAAYDGQGRVYAFDAATLTRKGTFRATSFAVTSDGKTLFTSEPCRIDRIDVATRSARPLYRSKDEDCGLYTHRDLAVSADGLWLTAFMHMMSGVAFDAFDARTGARAPWR